MTPRLAFIVVGVLAVSGPVQAAPAQLYGKSVVITWGESRMQRFVGETNFRSVSAGQEFSIYVSTAGRVFSRMTVATRRGMGAREAVGGGGGATTTFSGHGLAAFVGGRNGNSVRRLIVEFDGGFTGCSAKVVRAKEEGAKLGNYILDSLDF